MRAQRFIQASAMLRPEGMGGPARAIPVRLQPAPPPAKPGRRADEVAWLAYREAQKTQNLSMKGALISDLRDSMDQEGYGQRTLLVAVDGSYCNRTVLRQLPGRVEVVARARGDIRLFRPLSPTGVGDQRRKYGAELPRPKEVLADPTIPWRRAMVFGAGRVHELAYKAVAPVLWRSGTTDKPLRLFVIRPLRYRPRVGGPLLYRDPAYLLTTNLNSPEELLLQACFDRWEIEINHRDEKDLLGVGQAQVWSRQAAWRVPHFQVAVYAMLLLAALQAHGPRRTDAYLPTPKWRREESRRPSTLDILALLLEELMEVAIADLHPADGRAHPIRAGPGSQATPAMTPANPLTAALYASS